MPISGPSSYLPTTDEFLPHWQTADTTLGVGNEIVLPGGVPRAGLQTQRDALSTKLAEVQAKLNVLELARGDLELRKAGLLLRLNQFNDKIRALYPGSKWERALPLVPGLHEGQGPTLTPLDDMHSLWQLLDADGALPDLTLLGAYTQALFAADLAAFKTAYTTYNNAGTLVSITREERNDLQEVIYDLLKNYRVALPTYFAKTHALVDSLPRLTPEPGATPDAVSANGVWDVPTLMAKLTWAASSDANLSHYELRVCAGPNYSSDNESVLGSVLPNAPREFLTDSGLASPGHVATFKVYVLTTTGNEKGSHTVTITRP